MATAVSLHHCNGVRQGLSAAFNIPLVASRTTRRGVHYDGRNRLSKFWTPTQALKKGQVAEQDGHELLLRAGYLRQAHSGIFHLLPLGLRVQDKIEKLIDKHMQRLGASKVSLSSLSSEELWQRSGRLDKGRGSEFFRLEDRKGAKYLLSPTHEEEITTLVANAVHSYKDLPLRLYQISRKYRDEARPRQGLLRGREFLMKDLYTFDVTEQQARETYEDVRRAYSSFLDELRLPYLVANADSGNMGGSLSHEYHFASDKGEDTIIGCDKCDYSINEELYIAKFNSSEQCELHSYQEWLGISKDRRTLLRVHYPLEHNLNIYAVKAVYPSIDTSVEDPLNVWSESSDHATRSQLTLRDPRLEPSPTDSSTDIVPNAFHNTPILLTTARAGDTCPSCHSPSLALHQAVEIGHTFHLGTRYSTPLSAYVLNASNKSTPISMGCHGIGVSRLIGAVASLLADNRGLNWPLAIAPFGIVIVPTGSVSADDTCTIYDKLVGESASTMTLDAAIDDRSQPMGWKLNDADLIGYPFIAVLGKAWLERHAVELQCRRLGVREEVPAQDLARKIAAYAEQL